MNKPVKGILLGSALLAAPLLYAVPARNVVKTIVQPDGTTLQIKLCGDEFLRYYTTLDGVPFEKSYITYRQIMDGGVLEFVMGDTPSDWATDSRPYSLSEQVEF